MGKNMHNMKIKYKNITDITCTQPKTLLSRKNVYISLQSYKFLNIKSPHMTSGVIHHYIHVYVNSVETLASG